MRMHPDQLRIDADQVAALIADQCPELAGQSVCPVLGGGTVNAIFRVGSAAAVRFPLREQEPAVVRAELTAEASAAREFALASPFPAPEPLLIGEPGQGYPLPWSVQTWLDGATPTPTSSSGSTELALDLAALIGRLRGCDTRGRTFNGDNRGGRLPDHDGWVEECVDRTEGLFDTQWMKGFWASARTLSRDEPDAMCHTDLIPGNLLVTDGRLAGVLDTGGFQAADPALDLVCAWHLLDDGPREVLRRSLDCSELQWQRSRAWAFEQAAGAYWYYVDTNPTMAAMGRTTLERLAASF